MQIYNALVISQLVYGLETMYLNESLLKRLDAFQMKGIRHILGIEHAYWSRCSNEKLVERANKVVNGCNEITRKWKNDIGPKTKGGTNN